MTKDLMYTDEIHDLVYETYAALESPTGAATGFYDERQLDALPDGARQWALGVGNPISRAALAPGEEVVDLGCGAGVDVLLAAREVGPSGSATGVDFLAPMVERGRRFAKEAGLDNAYFIQGEIEDLPLPEESADVIVSNGTINLSARKSRVLAEAHRVLRPGGRMCVTDLTLSDEELPPEIRTHPSAWAG
ncbi:MAG: methyltransferase domain-containing protein [Actinomycetota bacterium]